MANHQTCKKCSDQVSRKHAIECLRLKEDIVRCARDFEIDENDEKNALDQLLNHVYESEDMSMYNKIARIIRRIYSECLGYIEKENGYWESEETQAREARRESSGNGRSRRRRNEGAGNELRNKRTKITKSFSKASVAPIVENPFLANTVESDDTTIQDNDERMEEGTIQERDEGTIAMEEVRNRGTRQTRRAPRVQGGRTRRILPSFRTLMRSARRHQNEQAQQRQVTNRNAVMSIDNLVNPVQAGRSYGGHYMSRPNIQVSDRLRRTQREIATCQARRMNPPVSLVRANRINPIQQRQWIWHLWNICNRSYDPP